MSLLTIECPECAGQVEVDEATLGQRVKCPKCKESFVADRPGLYDFVDDPAEQSPLPVKSPPPRPAQSRRGQPIKPAPDDESEALSDEMKSDLLSSMEKWAEE